MGYANSLTTAVLHPQRSADGTSLIETVFNRLSSKQVTIPQPAEVSAYLLRYPDMMDILSSVCKTVSERFERQTQLSLEMYHDPEIEDEYLTLYVRQNYYDKHILDIIEDISAEYEKKLTGKSGWLIVTTDFRPPTG